MRREFERCWNWLNASLCHSGCPTHTREQVWFRICNSNAYLWPGENCVILGEIINHPIGLRSFHYWLQGGELDELLTLHPGIEAWALTQNCHRATGRGRKGWLRKMHGDWQEGPVTRTKWLTEPPACVRAQ